MNGGGALKGAATGAAAGAALGPWGAAAGGIIGGALGLFGGDDPAPPDPVNLPYFQQDRDRISGMLDGRSAFASSDWNTLIGQLQARANGTAPSVAGNAFKQASQTAQNSLSSLAANSAAPGATRAAIMQQGKINQGMAQGYSQAALQEQQGAEGALQNALSTRDQINQQSYLNLLNQQMGLSQAQLRALQGNQGVGVQEQQIGAAQSAATWNALGGLTAGLAKIGGGSGGSSSGGTPVTSTKQVDPLAGYRRVEN